MNRISKKISRILTLIGLTILLVSKLHLLLPSLTSDFRNIMRVETETSYVLAAEKSPEPAPKLFPVVLDGKTLFSFSSVIPGVPPKARAERVSQTIERIAKQTSIPVENIKIFAIEGGQLISTEEEWILSITPTDAKAANIPLEKLAQSYLKKIKDAITEYREERRPERIVHGVIYTIISTIVLFVLLKFINFIFPKIHDYTYQNRIIFFRPLRIQNWQILSAEQQAEIFWRILKIFRLIIVLIILYIYIPLVLSFFPVTEQFGQIALNSLYSTLESTKTAFIKYLPNIFIMSIIIFITNYIIRGSRLFFQALENGTISIPGFYQDWAQPTYQLSVFLILALAGAIIFPYLPGSNSPAFQGVSILLGALVTFGGASTISNIFGGFITIYTRAFQLGDRITMSDYTGVVIEKTILSTRICTINNEIVTIPNSTIVASSITNYSASLRDLKQPLVLHTTITLGYDLPWRLVHETLIKAALDTKNLLSEPAPRVWQRSLDDFYVSYELRVYTNKPLMFREIYAELHQNIQDRCNEVGIEIMSPHYSALRDGNQSTIPANYLDKDYQAPSFRVDSKVKES